MQHAIGDHALLADGRSAALVDTAGNVAWLCTPRVDSPACLLSLLDDERGGSFSVRPASPGARLLSRRYHPRSLVLETVWAVGSQRLIVDDALTWVSGSLSRRLRASGGPLEVDVRFAPAFDMGRAAATWTVAGPCITARGAGSMLAVTSPGGWRLDAERASSHIVLEDGAGATVVLTPSTEAGADHDDSIEATLAGWRQRVGSSTGLRLREDVCALAGEATVRELVQTSAAVLLGLSQATGGIAAAPTTSLPQWPGSSRTWDYRYCWLRDSAVAARALLRAEQADTAARLGGFIAAVVAEHGPRALVRVDGSAAPEEAVRPELTGYRGARPVRTGNAAAVQAQLDVPGEVLELAWELAAVDALPQALAGAGATLADWLERHWREPDHGIWEIRGAPRRYTHSRVMAATGLGRAAALCQKGRIPGHPDSWARSAAAVRGDVLRPGTTVLELHAGGGGADAALAAVPLTGFLPPADPVGMRTLDAIASRLGRRGLLDRYEGQPDGIADPCAPFVFPTFWLAAALRLCGRDAGAHIEAALAARSPLGLWGEVADPDDGTPLGNYPQVQSHAAFLLTAIDA